MVVAGSLVAWARGRSGPVPLARAWPAAALAALVAWRAVAGLAGGAPWTSLVALRAFGFLGVALAAGWVTGEVLRRVVPWLVGLLAAQLLLSPLEFLRGIPIQGHMYVSGDYFARRAAGTFVMPNTLGVFAACVVALAEGFAATRRLRAAAWVLGGLVVVASGSATGLVMLAAVGVAAVARAGRGSRALALAGLGAGIAVAAVLLFAGRPDVLYSGAARLQGIRAALHGPPAQLLLGREFGLGTNARFQLANGIGNEAAVLPPGEPESDSAVISLVLQAGVPALALFLAALVLAGARSAPARPLALALAVAAVALIVTEAFPVNLLLGLLLALPGVRREVVYC